MVFIIGAVLVFVLPFAIPVEEHPQISASYVAGFNNRAAAIAAAAVSVLVVMWHRRRRQLLLLRPSSAEQSPARISKTLIGGMATLTCLFTALAGWAIHEAGQRYLADAGYFIEQMTKHVLYGSTLYSQLEFSYGPLLFYPTVWLQHVFHCSVFTAYFVTLAMEQLIGLLELAYILRVLPVRPGLRRFAFILFALGAITPLLGLNYTLFRYLTPLTLLFACAESTGVATSTLALAFGEAVSLSISAELGIAFCAGSAALLICKTREGGARWLVPILGVCGGGILFSATAGRGYLFVLTAFAKGALNLPVAPYPHLLFFLFAVIWMAPLAVAQAMEGPALSTSRIVACYVFGIALLPSALGRCDPLHVFFNGLALCLLSLSAVRDTSVWRSRSWALSLFLLVFWQVLITNRLFRFRTADTLTAVLPAQLSSLLARAVGESSQLGQHLDPGDDPDYKLDLKRLSSSVGASTIAVPLELPPDVETSLQQSNQFQSSAFAYMVNTFAASAEQKDIRELNASEWALVPQVSPPPSLELPEDLADLQGLSFPFPHRHAVPFFPGEAMKTNLREHWKKVDQLGPYVLLRNAHSPSLTPNL